MTLLSRTAVCSLASIALFTSAAAMAAVDWKKHPVLHKIYDGLETQRKAMLGDAHSIAEIKDEAKFGGHRVKAYELIVQAQKELEDAVEHADKPAVPAK